MTCYACSQNENGKCPICGRFMCNYHMIRNLIYDGGVQYICLDCSDTITQRLVEENKQRAEQRMLDQQKKTTMGEGISRAL